jgi:hypothetical protein
MTLDEVVYKVVYFDRTTGKIQVVYDGLDFLVPIELHLNPDTNLYPSGTELDRYIRSFCPLHIINKNIAIKEGVANESDIVALVDSTLDEGTNASRQLNLLINPPAPTQSRTPTPSSGNNDGPSVI